jgi:hypothetical protein
MRPSCIDHTPDLLFEPRRISYREACKSGGRSDPVCLGINMNKAVATRLQRLAKSA